MVRSSETMMWLGSDGLHPYTSSSVIVPPPPDPIPGINDPQARIVVNQQTGLEVLLTGGTSTAGATGALLIGFIWDLGDGTTANGVSVDHSYSAAGVYPVRLTVIDEIGGTSSTTQQVTVAPLGAPVDQPPVAVFSASINGQALTVDGSNSSDPDIDPLTFLWDFGDGGSAVGVTASHVYALSGNYTVTLTVADPTGLTNSTSQTVGANTAPIPALAVTPSGLSVHADASASRDGAGGTIVGYDIDWGDGTAHAGTVTADHAYAAAGTYTVTLTLTDNQGAGATAATAVSVKLVDSFVLGTSKPDATNTGVGIVRPVPTGAGGTINSVVVPGASINSSPQNVAGVCVVATGTTLTGKTINGDVVLVGTGSITDCVVHGRIICSGAGSLVENNLIDGYSTAAEYNTGSNGGVCLVTSLRNSGGVRNTVQYNTIKARITTNQPNGIGFRNFDAYRNDVSNTVDGINLSAFPSGQDPNATVKGNYIHDATHVSPDSTHPDNMSHNDGSQTHGGAIWIEGNNYDMEWGPLSDQSLISPVKNLSAVMINNDFGVPNLTVKNNWFKGGQTLINGQGGTNLIGVFTGNRFDLSITPGFPAWFKPASQPNITWTGNINSVTGAAVNPTYS